MLLMIDNYDSFTFNLVHYFRTIGQDVQVHRNDQISIAEITALAPQYIVLSPGPSTPDNAGITLAVLKHFAGKIPILGVCLGHQSIAQHFGATISKAQKPMHGKTSKIQHEGTGLFAGLHNPLEVTRYHSLIVQPETLHQDLKITAWTINERGDFLEIMALEHKQLAISAVQFHPESVMTEQGHQLLRNFIEQYQQINQ